MSEAAEIKTDGMMMQCVKPEAFGGPEVLKLVETPRPAPGGDRC